MVPAGLLNKMVWNNHKIKLGFVNKLFLSLYTQYTWNIMLVKKVNKAKEILSNKTDNGNCDQSCLIKVT